MAADARPSHRLVTVMAGYARDNRLSSVTQRWIDALRRVSTQLVLIFDQDHVEGLEKFSPSDSGVVCLCERHGATTLVPISGVCALPENSSGWIKRPTCCSATTVWLARSAISRSFSMACKSSWCRSGG